MRPSWHGPDHLLQEFLGHRDFKTTLIYADYAPSAGENELVERAFGAGNVPGTNLSATESKIKVEQPS